MSNATEKANKLQVYADGLKRRLQGQIPERHSKTEGSKSAFKQMLEIDLKKTEAQIAKLRG